MSEEYELIELPDLQYRALIYNILMRNRYGTEFEDHQRIYDLEDSRAYFKEWRRDDIAGFRRWVEKTLEMSGRFPKRLTWRDVPFNPNKIKICANCGRPFYDVSRNGKALNCTYQQYERWDQTNYRYRTSYHADGRPKSHCEMEWAAKKKVRQFNLRRHGRDTTQKFGYDIPRYGRYKVKRVLGGRNGVPPTYGDDEM